MLPVCGDVTEHVLHFFGETEPDGDRVYLIDRFRRIRHFFQDGLAQSERQIGYRPLTGLEKARRLWVGRAAHDHPNIH